MTPDYNGLVSVVVPTWNRSATIMRAIRSIQAQSYPNIEILISDDGSTDGTMNMLEENRDSRLRIVKGAHSGKPSVAKNRAIREAKGHWIAFLDSDDEWLPDKLEKQMNLMQSLNLRASSTNAYRLLESRYNDEEFIFWKKRKITFNNLLAGNLVISSSALVQREVLNFTGGFPEQLKIAEDYALWLRVATQTAFAFVPERLVLYYDQPAKSVRGKEIGIADAKRNVFADFREWCAAKPGMQKYPNRIKWRYFLQVPDLMAVTANVIKKLSRGIE